MTLDITEDKPALYFIRTGVFHPETSRREKKRIWKVCARYFHDTQADRLFMKLPNGKGVQIVNREDRVGILRQAHDEAGHVGVHKTLAAIREIYFWKNVTADVRKYIRACGLCKAHFGSAHGDESEAADGKARLDLARGKSGTSSTFSVTSSSEAMAALDEDSTENDSIAMDRSDESNEDVALYHRDEDMMMPERGSCARAIAKDAIAAGEHAYVPIEQGIERDAALLYYVALDLRSQLSPVRPPSAMPHFSPLGVSREGNSALLPYGFDVPEYVAAATASGDISSGGIASPPFQTISHHHYNGGKDGTAAELAKRSVHPSLHGLCSKH